MSKLVLLLAFVVGCSRTSPAKVDPDAATTPDATDAAPDAGPDFCNATDPRATPIEVAATPEAGEQPYIDALMPAQTSISVEIYEMGYGGILTLLEQKAQAGVNVRVILDHAEISVNQKYYDALAAAGAHVQWSGSQFVYTHAKFFVVDNQVAVFSTGNFSKTYSIDLERNFVSTDRDQADVADLIAIFEADWAGQTPQMSCTRMILSPINSRTRILDLINGAQTTLTIESMQFSDTAVREAVKARIAAGVQTRVMLADANWISANAAASQYLKDLGVTVKWIPHLHTKVMVIDGVRAYVGSENLSSNSLDHNREVGAIVTDASSITPLTDTFEKDWAAGTAF